MDIMIGGYDTDRFINPVRPDFLCSICLCVLKDARLCKTGEHYFCFTCITKHLAHSETCPQCCQPLTPVTLSHPQRFFRNALSELRIKCDYIDRGCPEHVELGNLQNHVNNCEYRPVKCEYCHVEINAKNEDNHKKSFCLLGGAFKEIKLRQAEMKEDFTIIRARQKEFDDKQKEVEETQNAYGQKLDYIDNDLHEMEGSQKRQKRKLKEIVDNCEKIRTNLDEMEDNQNLQRQELNEVTNSCEEIQTFTNTVQDEMRSEVTGIKTMHSNIQKQVKKIKVQMGSEVGELKRRHDDIYLKMKKMKTNADDLKIQHLQVARKQEQMHVGQEEMKKALDEMKQTQSGINKKVEKMEMMERKFERFEGLLGHLFLENIVNRNGAQATDLTIPTNNQDVIILGGRYAFGEAPPLNTVEKYNIVEKRSTMLPPFNHPREQSASCVHNNDVFIVGGYDGENGTDTIQVLKMNQRPLRWTMFDGKLPVKLSSHDIIVYQGKLYIIGGCDQDERKTLNAIYEIALTPPYTAKLLTRMPEPRRNHRAELVNGKLFILGGTTTGSSKDALNSVVIYDLNKNEFKPYPCLPQPVSRMSTVTWGNKIILVGGEDKNEEALSDVIMYDTETGQSDQLPSMIHKRSGCSAVVMNDVIVVFGGFNREEKELNSVESFTIGGDAWEELPGMIEKRWYATAVVKPHN